MEVGNKMGKEMGNAIGAGTGTDTKMRYRRERKTGKRIKRKNGHK